MMKKIFLLGLICLVLLSACSTNKVTVYTDLIQISIFREIGYDACIGSLSEEKMSFTSDQRGGVSGSITLDNDLAVVQFEQIGYFENSKVTTYLFHKTSDDPNIDEQLN